MNGIKQGSKVTINKIVVKEVADGDAQGLVFDQYDNVEGVVISVWDYPPDDRKFEVNLRPPNHGKIVVRESDIGG